MPRHLYLLMFLLLEFDIFLQIFAMSHTPLHNAHRRQQQ